MCFIPRTPKGSLKNNRSEKSFKNKKTSKMSVDQNLFQAFYQNKFFKK